MTRFAGRVTPSPKGYKTLQKAVRGDKVPDTRPINVDLKTTIYVIGGFAAGVVAHIQNDIVAAFCAAMLFFFAFLSDTEHTARYGG